MKTKFELEGVSVTTNTKYREKKGQIHIIGTRPKFSPYVVIEISGNHHSMGGFIRDRDLELFAVNILKALKSKRLKV